jgi:hypothetical protein
VSSIDKLCCLFEDWFKAFDSVYPFSKSCNELTEDLLKVGVTIL